MLNLRSRKLFLVPMLCCLLSLYVNAETAERLGTVSFKVSCAPGQQAAFNRGVALVHDFWYEEAERQFTDIVKADPGCSMAHWGIGMSLYQQIWGRPGPEVMARGWAELQQATDARTDREKEYIAALANFYKPGPEKYEARVDAYSAAMGTLRTHYPDDVDASAFYALSLLADVGPNDTSLTKEHEALAIAAPLFEKYSDHPGLAHYIIHASDNPSMARQGLHAAERYGVIAPSGAHAAHMGGHIFARLGMWREDIDANLAAVEAAHGAARTNRGGGFDELHPDEFLLYAYLQNGDDTSAKSLLDQTIARLDHAASMPGMAGDGMYAMGAFYSTELPAFYALERRDWKTAAALNPTPGSPAYVKTLTYWARAIGNGHLKNGSAAKADLEKYESLIDEIRKGPDSYAAEGTSTQIAGGTIRAWASYAQGDNENALKLMRSAADLQDKVGQGEVDIPVREMLGDMLLDLNRPKEALVEYQRALKLSPNRFNGLYNAGRAAMAAGDKKKAREYYAALLNITGGGLKSTRPEIADAKAFVK